MERATALRLVEAAHQVCPYSRATHGNIAVETTLACPLMSSHAR
jgi:organic hydroperoxide reductase OsmC/OhrA